MENNNATCKNCKRVVPQANIVLHEAQCREVVRQSENFEEEYTYCQRCDNYIPRLELTDHKLSHEFENELQRVYHHEGHDGGEMDIESDEELSEEPQANRLSRSNNSKYMSVDDFRSTRGSGDSDG
jgi:hypothetical protein